MQQDQQKQILLLFEYRYLEKIKNSRFCSRLRNRKHWLSESLLSTKPESKTLWS